MIKYTDDDKRALLEKLDIYRLHNSLTYKKLAEQLNIFEGTIRSWESKGQLPNKVHCYHIERLVKNFVIS
jgi:DNA-binding transcriptional regulator YiaG